jgi:WD40 repeat protein
MRTLFAASVVCGLCWPVAAADPTIKTDRHGDPLPAGALMRLGTIRNRAPITGFGIAKDGTVVTIGPGADVRRWRATEDKNAEPFLLPPVGPSIWHNHPIVSPNGRYVAACSKEKVFVWETPTDGRVKPKEVAAFEIRLPGSYCFSPDGTKLVVTTGQELFESLQRKCPAYLCDLRTGKASEVEGDFTGFCAVNFSGDGTRAVALADGGFYLLDTTTAKKVAGFKFEKLSYDACALNHRGDLLVAQPYLQQSKFEWHFFDALTGKRRDDLVGPDGGDWATFAPDGKTVLVGDHNGIQWWDPAARKLIRRFEGCASPVPARFSPDGKTLVVSSGHVLLRWDVATGKPLFPEQGSGHAQALTGLGISPDGKRIASSGRDGRLCVWDAATGAGLWRAPADQWTCPRINYSPDGKFLYAGVPNRNEVVKYDAGTGKELLKLIGDAKQPKRGGVETIRVAADGKTVSALISPSEVLQYAQFVVWDSSTGARLKTAHVYDKECRNSDLSPDGACIAIGSDPAMVIPVAEQSVNYLKEAKLRSAGTPAFSDDGKWLTVIARANTPDGVFHSWAVVYSTKTWKEVCSVSVAESARAALSPDGKTLAVAANDKLEFYDTATAKPFSEYKLPIGSWNKGLLGSTTVVRFTPDGTKLVSGHADTTALVWAVPARPAK